MRVGHSNYASDINSVSGGKKNKLRLAGLLILLPFRSNWATQLKTGARNVGGARKKEKKRVGEIQPGEHCFPLLPPISATDELFYLR